MKTAPFYPGLIKSEVQDEIRRSELWPVILSLHFNTGGKIYVAEVSFIEEVNINTIIHMRSINGTHVLQIRRNKNDKEIVITMAQDILNRNVHRRELLASTSTKYIANKLKVGMPNLETVKHHIEKYDLLPNLLNKINLDFGRNVRESNSNLYVSLDTSTQEFVLRKFFGEQVYNDDYQLDLEKAYKEVQAVDAKRAAFNQKYKDMFNPEKHLLVYLAPTRDIPNHMFLVGKMKQMNMDDSNLKCVVTDNLKLVNRIGENSELMASLAFWKLVRENRGQKERTVDIEKFLTTFPQVDLEAGSMMLNADGGMDNFIYLVHRIGEQDPIT